MTVDASIIMFSVIHGEMEIKKKNQIVFVEEEGKNKEMKYGLHKNHAILCH